MKLPQLIFIIVLLVACRSENKTPHKGLEIDLNNSVITSSDSLNLTDLSYIFLQEDENNIVGHISKLLCVNNKIYIFDDQSQMIFCFDSIGNFIYKIDGRGKGPGEYIKLKDFYVSDKEEVFVYDNFGGKIIKYSNRGNEYKEIEISHTFLEFYFVNENEILVRDLYSKGKIIAPLAIINTSDNSVQTILDPRDTFDDIDIPYYYNYYIYKSGNSLLYNPRFSNQILVYCNGSLSKKIVFPNDDYFIDKSEIKNIINDGRHVFNLRYNICDISSIFENKEIFYFYILQGQRKIAIVNKQNNKLCIFNRFNNKNYFGKERVIGTSNDFFISEFNPGFAEDSDWDKKVQNTTLPDTTKEKLLNYKQHQTTILIRFKIDA